MNDFLKELPALIITLAILAMTTLVILIEHFNISDSLAIMGAIVSPAVSFWFIRGAFAYSPPQTIPQAEKNPTNP